mmetsp:Transcript_35067/g.69205  ORF Transcript_35067/g.69205 Transcript_35067/m.69205 type:complete len:111 (-) Transcript_35067:792-1124(-)
MHVSPHSIVYLFAYSPDLWGSACAQMAVSHSVTLTCRYSASQSVRREAWGKCKRTDSISSNCRLIQSDSQEGRGLKSRGRLAHKSLFLIFFHFRFSFNVFQETKEQTNEI